MFADLIKSWCWQWNSQWLLYVTMDILCHKWFCCQQSGLQVFLRIVEVDQLKDFYTINDMTFRTLVKVNPQVWVSGNQCRPFVLLCGIQDLVSGTQCQCLAIYSGLPLVWVIPSIPKKFENKFSILKPWSSFLLEMVEWVVNLLIGPWLLLV